MGKQQGVRKASDTTIEIDFYYKGARCRERLPLKPTPANLKRAARHRAAIMLAIENDTFDYAVTFPKSKNVRRFMRQDRIKPYLDNWLASKKPTLKSSTYEGYRKIIDGHLIPAFGDLMLAEFRRGHVRDYAATLTCSNKRIANILSVMRSALNNAFHDDLVGANVLAGWHYRRQEAVSATPKRDNKPDPFTTEEQTAILEALSDEERPIIEFAFWTGLRTSELAALEWQDINWDRKQFRVERALTQAARGKAETPKTASGIRVVDLLPRAIHALKQQWEISSEHPTGRVFLNPRTGEPWTGDQAIRKTLWAHALKRAGVRYRRQYQTRHTYASMMVSAGEPLAWVSKQMGHSDVLITARTYAQWIPQSQKEYGNKAHQLYG